MKFTQKILMLVVVGVAALCAVPVKAQIGPDVYYTTRTLQLAPFENFSLNTAPLVTNGPVDRATFIGRGYIDLFAYTNAGGAGTLTATIYTSPDQTNLTTLANYALVTNTTAYSITNYYYGNPTNLVCANNYYLPGTVTAATPSSSLFAGLYLVETPFTNTGAINMPVNGTTTRVGVNFTDQARYFYVVWHPAGANTNWTVGANLTTATSTPIY
jgi:hypothetical protein